MSERNKDREAAGPVGEAGGARDYLEGFLAGDQDRDATPVDGTPGDNGAPNSAADSGLEVEAPEGDRELEMRVIDVLRGIYDPEIPVNIYDLGLIYRVFADGEGNVIVTMTLTTPHCPVAEIMPGEVETRVRAVEGVDGVRVDLVWDPPWDPTMMTEAAQLELGFI